MFRLLPLLLVGLIVTFIISLTILPVRRELAYRFGLSGDPTLSCCNAKEVISSNGNFDENANFALYDGQEVDYPKTSLASLINSANDQSNVLGTTNSAGEEKWIEVSLSEQHVRAWEGNKVVMEFPISSGKWAPTPKGTFYIWYKTRFQKMEGGKKEWGTYYNLPNVPNNMFFYQGYALHGAYWHNNFGHPMSHGCVNEPLDKAQQIFDWAGPVLPPGVGALKASAENPGTRVFIH